MTTKPDCKEGRHGAESFLVRRLIVSVTTRQRSLPSPLRLLPPPTIAHRAGTCRDGRERSRCTQCRLSQKGSCGSGKNRQDGVGVSVPPACCTCASRSVTVRGGEGGPTICQCCVPSPDAHDPSRPHRRRKTRTTKSLQNSPRTCVTADLEYCTKRVRFVCPLRRIFAASSTRVRLKACRLMLVLPSVPGSSLSLLPRTADTGER